MTAATETRAAMSSAAINDLPDSAFAYIEPGGTKDAEGKTTPRSKRHFPVHDAAHTRNALARLSSSPFGDKARPAVLAAAKKFGIEVSDDDGRAARKRLETLRRRARMGLSRDGARQMERRGVLLEMRARPDGTGGTSFVFEGYGATFDQPFDMWDQWGDPYTEVVRPGAFTRSLARPDLDVPFLIGHNDAGIPLARTRNGTMRLSQDTRGLHVSATMDGGRSDVRNLASAVERGDLDEMSIGFVTMGQEWSEDWGTRSMLDMELHRGDVSAVALAANPATAGATMFAMPGEAASAWRPGEARAASHPPFTGTHTHAHPAYGDGGQHEHEHQHQGDANHDHHAVTTDDPDSDGLTPTLSANAAALSSGRPLEQLARGEVADSDSHPDFNVAAGPVSNGVTAVKCPYEGRNGCGVMNPGGNRFCGNCGGPLYDGDGLMVLDDAGVVEEVAGAQGDANLLSLRLRLLELA